MLQVSEKYYAEQHLIPGLFDIGTWDFRIYPPHPILLPTDFYELLTEFLSFFPWLQIQRLSLGYIPGYWAETTSEKTFKDWCLEGDKLYKDEGYEFEYGMDIAMVDHSYLMSYEGISFSLENDRTGFIYIIYSEDGSVSLELTLKVDVFHEQPKDSDILQLTNAQANYNNCLLTQSLKAIEASGMYKIEQFYSDLYPEQINREGFKF